MHGVTVGFALIGSSSGHFRGCLCLGLPRLRTQLGQIHLWDSRHPQGKEIDSLSIGGIVISFRFLRTYGTYQDLEAKISRFHGKEDSILYASCFDANAGLFEQLMGPEDAVFSDALNHASIIDGLRLCKAKKHRYAHKDMKGLEK